jgi:RND superfamily putative drug exporter
MFCVSAAFGAFDARAPRITGAGLAARVLVNAMIARLIRVSAAMKVLGGRDRWFPRLSFPRLTFGAKVP